MPTQLRYRIGSLAALLVVAWCVMSFAHELGHIICGWAGGGRLMSAELRPWHLPYSLFQPDPLPLITLWGGPVLGVAIPLLIAACIRRPRVWFIAYFCVLANGVYLAVGWMAGDRYLDTPQLLQHGAHPAAIALYCVLTIAPGYIGFRRQCLYLLRPRAAGTCATQTSRATGGDMTTQHD